MKSCFLEIIDQSLRSGLNINEAINMQKREYLLPERRRVELWKFCFCLKVNICWRISLAFLLELVFNLICNTLSRIMPHARLTDRWLIINLTPTELMHSGHQVLASSTCPPTLMYLLYTLCLQWIYSALYLMYALHTLFD